jgi:large repetitive protein
MRFALALLVAIALSGVVLTSALAVRFADAPCPEAGPGRPRICPLAVVGKPYVVLVTGEAGCGPDPNVPGSGLPYQFRLLNGSLPPGLRLEKNGLLTGTPTTVGTWSFWVELSDEDPPSASWCVPKKSEREFTIQVSAPPATVGTPYKVGVGSAGIEATTWSIASGMLPPGLALSPSAGTISGTPAITGAFQLELSAKDSAGRTATVELVVVVYPKLVFATSQLLSLKVSRSFHATIRTSGGVRPVKLRVRSGRLPVGMRFNRNTGVLSGRPHKAGVYRVTIEARDGLDRTTQRTYVLNVGASKKY